MGQNVDMSMTVWLDGWQMQCCGEPFQVGSVVSWNLTPLTDPIHLPGTLGDDGARVTHTENHHGPDNPDGTVLTVGTVEAIQKAFCKVAPMPGDDSSFSVPVPGSGWRSTRTSASSADGDEGEDDDTHFLGYVVEIVPAS
jgi:hypothetical protein